MDQFMIYIGYMEHKEGDFHISKANVIGDINQTCSFNFISGIQFINSSPLVSHICVSESGQHWPIRRQAII